MGLIFVLYEVTSHNDVEIHTEHTINEVLRLEGSIAMLITEYFYYMNGRVLHDNIRESDVYISCSGYDLLGLEERILEIITEEDEFIKGLLAVNYFPTTFQKGYYVSNIKILTDEYYSKLKEIYDRLFEIIPTNSVSNKERLFLYNVSF